MSDAPLMLSVSGMRGWVGQSITPPVVSRYAAAFGTWLKSKHEGSGPLHVVVGRDSRPSGEMFEMAAAAGLIAVGCRVTRLGIVSTPGVAVMAKHLDAHGAMVITASHNPIIWNGLKAILRDGFAPPPEDARDIIERFKTDNAEYADVEALLPCAFDDTAPALHHDAILPHVDVDAIRGARLRIVLDSVHGAGGPEARVLLDRLGVEIVHLYGETTGLFPHTPEPTRENLTNLCDAMKQHDAHIGFAQDPDADRLAIVDEQGNYIGEEYTLALCALHRLAKGDTAVTNLSTSRMIDDIAANVGATIYRTPVGEAHVAKAMKQHGTMIGGEGNGGVIFSPISYTRDSFIAMALLLEMLAKRQQPLSRIIQSIPTYAIIKDKVDVDPHVVARMADAMQRQFADQTIDLQDGVRVDWPDRWVHVRPSNTEPILRIIAEARDQTAARKLITQTRDALGLR